MFLDDHREEHIHSRPITFDAAFRPKTIDMNGSACNRLHSPRTGTARASAAYVGETRNRVRCRRWFARTMMGSLATSRARVCGTGRTPTIWSLCC